MRQAREKTFKIRLSNFEWAKLEAEANRRQMSVAELIRKLAIDPLPEPQHSSSSN